MDAFDQEKRSQEGRPEEAAPLASQGHDPLHVSAAHPAQGGSEPHTRPRLRQAWEVVRPWLLAHPRALTFPTGPSASFAFGYLMAVLLPLVALLATALLVHAFPTFRFQGMLVILAVLFIALTWGVGPSMLATFVGAALLLFLLLPPVFSRAWARPEKLLGVGLYLGIGFTVSVLTSQTQRARRHAAARADQLEAILVERKRLMHERAEAQVRILALATTDPITELPNHRALMARLEQELERAQQYNRSCSLLFLDLDHFKALNDGYGHTAGDAVLGEFANLVRATLRHMDTVGRWGGEEFVAILPEIQADEALTWAERVRAAVTAYTFSVGGGLHLTCSAGVASYPVHGQVSFALLSAADHAMYAAKRFGRNQVRVAHDPAVLALFTARPASGGREEAALVGMVEALATLVEVRDASTGHHSQQVADLVLQLALGMGLPIEEAQMVALAARLHDIGKVAIPDTVLQKPDPLTQEEWELMRTHPVVGADVVSYIPALRPLAPVIRAHHERWDGQGYPDHLQGEAIPLGARILMVADAYLAMTVDRPYQKARAPAVALAELHCCARSQFDPQVVIALEQMLLAEQQVPGR